MKYYKNEVSIKEFDEFKKACEDVLNWSKYPLVVGMVSSKGFTNDAVEYVQQSKSKINGEHTVSLIQLEGNMFKVLWTG